LLVYNNPDKYIKANNEGIVIKGNTITTNDLEVYGNATIFGGVSASNIPPYDNNPENVATFADVGSSTAYSRGDHIHALDINNFINGTLNEINITDNLNGTATLSIPFSSSMASKIANNEADIISIGNYTASLANNLHSLTSNEISQLLNINSNLISNTEWGYLASLNQSLTTTSDVQFNIFTASNAQLTNIVSSIIEANTITASNAQFTTNE
jgi:hypothetical protein